MSPISRSGPRRWIAALMLLIMALTTAALAEGSACPRANMSMHAELAPHANLADTTSDPVAPLDPGNLAANATCGTTAIAIVQKPHFVETPPRAEQPIRDPAAPLPEPEPIPRDRPPRQS